jgi:hypothetical protein
MRAAGVTTGVCVCVCVYVRARARACVCVCVSLCACEEEEEEKADEEEEEEEGGTSTACVHVPNAPRPCSDGHNASTEQRCHVQSDTWKLLYHVDGSESKVARIHVVHGDVLCEHRRFSCRDTREEGCDKHGCWKSDGHCWVRGAPRMQRAPVSQSVYLVDEAAIVQKGDELEQTGASEWPPLIGVLSRGAVGTPPILCANSPDAMKDVECSRWEFHTLSQIH